MKYLVIFLVVSLTASEKLDRTYLPPPGAQFAGGNPGDILAPLETPSLPKIETVPGRYTSNRFKGPEEPLIKLPITTTSYAFTQTTTFPSIESFDKTVGPINPILGFPIQNPGQNNLQYNQNLPGPLNQNQNVIGTESEVIIPTHFQQPVLNPNYNTRQYPSEPLDKKNFGQYSGQDIFQSYPGMAPDNISSQDKYSEDHNQGVLADRINQDNTYRLSDENTPLPPYSQNNRGQITEGAPQGVLRPIKHSERPHAERDRDAVIINYENVLTPYSYSYNYDTSNGIHADESGFVEDGTKAKGSYSYTGDDGKLYSIFYTADENGFQPHGEHLPTSPPIPEAIQKVIEQAARDKEAGIIDDGSYDENKYGYKNYYSPIKNRRLQGNELESVNNIHTDNENKSYTKDFENGKNEEDTAEIRKKLKGESDDFTRLNDNKSISDSQISRSYDTSRDIPVINNNVLPVPGKYNGQSNISDIKPNQIPNSKQELLKHQTSGFSNDGYSEIKDEYPDIRENVKHKDIINRVSEKVNKNIEEKIPNADQKLTDKTGNNLGDSYFTSDPNHIQQLNKNGYYYNLPDNQGDRFKFTTRFKAEKVPLMTEPTYKTSDKITTTEPLTPEVRIKETNRQQYYNPQATTLRPFMTSRVTVPGGDSYSDYDDEEDQDIDDKGATSPKLPSELINNGARRLHRPSSSVTASTVSPPDNPISSYSSSFSNTQTNQKKIPVSLNSFGDTKTSNDKYETTRPYFDVDTTSTPHYPSTIEVNQGTYIPSKLKEFDSRGYSTTTLKPLSSTTSTTPGYKPESDYFRLSQISPKSNGYQYQPVISNYDINPQISERLNYGVNPVIFQVNNEPIDNSGSILKDSTSSRAEGSVSYGPEIKYDLTTPAYVEPFVSSTPSQGFPISSGFLKTSVPQTLSSGYVYEPPKIIYPNISSFSKIETIPDLNVPSTETSRLSQIFSVTPQPLNYSFPQDSYNPNAIVDGFGRPITSESRSLITPDTKVNYEERLQRPEETSVESNSLVGYERENTLNPKYDVPPSPSYSEYNNQAKVDGEDFSGPKQPQQYNPRTGYYYK